MGTYTISAPPPFAEGSGDTVTGIVADRVIKEAEGDLVFYENPSTSVGSSGDREVARFKAHAWEYYYEENE